jgi:hypothetical protein
MGEGMKTKASDQGEDNFCPNLKLSKIQFGDELRQKPARRPALRFKILLILSPVAPASVPVLFLDFDTSD